MKILLTNDDGINSQGILLLAKTLSKRHTIYIVAPSGERSAFSHSLTINRPLYFDKVDNSYADCAYSVSGTPADCVKFALKYIKIVPDIIISGINRGSNLGTDIMYSGTVSAAMEGALNGYKAIALSSVADENNNFQICCDFVANNLQQMFDLEIVGNIININFPNVDIKNIKGVCVTKQGVHRYDESYKCSNTDGIDNYFLSGDSLDVEDDAEECDVKMAKRNYITITPLMVDRTNYKMLDKLKESFNK